jgi:hypothetical protein
MIINYKIDKDKVKTLKEALEILESFEYSFSKPTNSLVSISCKTEILAKYYEAAYFDPIVPDFINL